MGKQNHYGILGLLLSTCFLTKPFMDDGEDYRVEYYDAPEGSIRSTKMRVIGNDEAIVGNVKGLILTVIGIVVTILVVVELMPELFSASRDATATLESEDENNTTGNALTDRIKPVFAIIVAVSILVGIVGVLLKAADKL